MKAFTSSKAVAYVLAVLLIFVLWKTISCVVNALLILPPPEDVFRALFQLIGKTVFWRHVGVTVLRCFISFLISMLIGSIVGCLCGISTFFNNFFSIPVAVIRATPVVSFILIALFWFSSSHVPIFISILMTLPVVISSVSRGFATKDKKLEAMAKIYRFTNRQKARWITLPAVLPFFLSGAVSAFGLTWKVVVAGEVLSIPTLGAGALLQSAQVHLNTADVMAITFVIVAMSFLLEKLLAFTVSKIVLLKGKQHG